MDVTTLARDRDPFGVKGSLLAVDVQDALYISWGTKLGKATVRLKGHCNVKNLSICDFSTVK